MILRLATYSKASFPMRLTTRLRANILWLQVIVWLPWFYSFLLLTLFSLKLLLIGAIGTTWVWTTSTSICTCETMWALRTLHFLLWSTSLLRMMLLCWVSVALQRWQDVLGQETEGVTTLVWASTNAILTAGGPHGSYFLPHVIDLRLEHLSDSLELVDIWFVISGEWVEQVTHVISQCSNHFS